MIDEIVLKLLRSFPGSFINFNGDFIAHDKDQYFDVKRCKGETDIKCSVLEWFSRSYKVHPFRSDKRNLEFQAFMRDGINTFLGTDFCENDLRSIYGEIGNAINRQLTIKFIESGYKLSVLEEQ